ncbi:MAG: DNA-directed DNA polymerase, partial [Candidatus ainarchaeum sp.]|nr:DNA-directed DNA polymerase [Candidatus ainarchaeum sp.]
VDYAQIGADSAIQVFLRTKKGILEFFDFSFRPYFLLVPKELAGTEKAKKSLLTMEFGEEHEKIFALEEIEKSGKPVLKAVFRTTKALKGAREELKQDNFFEMREFDIPFAKRYLLDRGLAPMSSIEISFVEGEGRKKVTGIKDAEPQGIELKIAAVDIETYSPDRFSNPEKDPILMISYAGKTERAVFSTKKKLEKNKNCRIFSTEAKMISGFVEFVKEKKLDIIVSYNGDNFDFPYFKERCRKLKIRFDIGFEGSSVIIKKKGVSDRSSRFKGMQHLDAFHMLRMLSRFGVVSIIKYDLESVVKRLYNYEKKKIHAQEINKIWETEKGLEGLADYNLEDSVFALRIAEDYLPLLAEFCGIVGQNIFDVGRASASQLVESLLIRKAFEMNELVPNRPSETSVAERVTRTFKGGYVKEPIAGLHENIAVLDFRSLHPSIIISHNISPDSLNCMHKECMAGKNLAPDRDWFCEKKQGFLPIVLKDILGKRIAIKKEIKKVQKGTEEFRKLNARQQALKILLNSHYGYLGFARARWYSMECARAVTAWSRHYVREVIHKTEEAGFTALYSDTDSCFLEIPKGKTREDVKKFVEKINSELPEAMDLEIDGFYKRGIFVTRREGKQAAKKRYALIDFEDKLKIVGFEYVRRDWAKVAKETQKQVLETVLKEGNPKKAVEIIRRKIIELKSGQTPKSDLVVLTQIKRPLDRYVSVGPHVAAAKKAVLKGKEIEVGSVIGFIITKCGESISDKAQLEEFVKEGNYDADYYITHQLVPAVIRIIQELGYNTDDLIQGGKQQKLGAFGEG